MQFLEKLWKMRKYIEISQTCHNRNEKKPFGVRTKLLYYKVFPKTSINNRNEENWKTFE